MVNILKKFVTAVLPEKKEPALAAGFLELSRLRKGMECIQTLA